MRSCTIFSVTRNALSVFYIIITAVCLLPGNVNAQDVWANADANRGWQYFGNCAACHTIGKGQRHKVGPNLFGIVGHPAGARDDYAGYTPALRNSELVWDAATLDRYLENNKLVVPGNRMACGRIPDPQIRADIITYLSLFHE